VSSTATIRPRGQHHTHLIGLNVSAREVRGILIVRDLVLGRRDAKGITKLEAEDAQFTLAMLDRLHREFRMCEPRSKTDNDV